MNTLNIHLFHTSCVNVQEKETNTEAIVDNLKRVMEASK